MSAKRKFWNKQAFIDSENTAAADATSKVAAQAAAEDKIVNGEITLSSASNVGFVVVPVAGKVKGIYSVIDGVLTTGDETLSFAVSGGTSMGSIVITQSGSAAGDVDSLTPSANNTVVAGDTIDITTDGANGTATKAKITVLIRDA